MADHHVLIAPGDGSCSCGAKALPGGIIADWACAHAAKFRGSIEYAQDPSERVTLVRERDCLRDELVLERAKVLRLRRALDALIEDQP